MNSASPTLESAVKRIAAVLTCVAAASFALAAPGHADTARTGTAQARVYKLELYTPAEQREETGMSWYRAVVLTCDPPGGSHPRADEACGLIAEHGSIAGIQGVGDGVCTMVYRPVTARVTGAEEYEETFSNACVMRSAKGAVLDF
ncbi:SSI family serine proteinase inhibitor [Nocardiopsis terrae]